MIVADVCPFSDPDFLTEIADQSGAAFIPQRNQLLDELTLSLNNDQRRLLTEIDNLAIK